MRDAPQEEFALLFRDLFSDFLHTLQDGDLEVKKAAFEALITLSRNMPGIVKEEIETVLKIVMEETVIRKELITEVDRGPFKVKDDLGKPLRKSAFTILDNLLVKLPEKVDIPMLMESIKRGLCKIFNWFNCIRC